MENGTKVLPTSEGDFENVANNSANLNPNVFSAHQKAAGGFQGYHKLFRNGCQVWTQTLNGKLLTQQLERSLNN